MIEALSKFLVLLALALLASLANEFTSLSLVAGDQIQVNYLTQLQQLISYPMNEPSREPICNPTHWMDLDAVLPNNLSSKKTWVAYSEPMQDAKLPSKITDSTNSQTYGLCHNKNSERVMFSDKKKFPWRTVMGNLCRRPRNQSFDWSLWPRWRPLTLAVLDNQKIYEG